MAITTIDSLVAGMQPPLSAMKVGASTTIGRLYSPFYVAGNPGAAVAPTPGIAGAALTTYLGQLPFLNPVAGEARLAGFSANANVAGELWLCDRLWHNSGMSSTSTSSQSVNSAAFPARDMDGATSGEGVYVGVEVSTVMGSGAPTFTLGYTNSLGTAGRSIVTPAQPATMAVGSFIQLPLMAGDTGVRSVQTFKLSTSMTSGTYHLVAFRVLAKAQVTSAYLGMSKDAIGLGMPLAHNDTVPFLLWLPATTTAPVLYADVAFSHG